MIEKNYFKKTPFCRVTFMLPKEATVGVKQVNLVGDFNNWDSCSTPMKNLINGKYWELDRDADKFVKCPLNNCDNSVVVV